MPSFGRTSGSSAKTVRTYTVPGLPNKKGKRKTLGTVRQYSQNGRTTYVPYSAKTGGVTGRAFTSYARAATSLGYKVRQPQGRTKRSSGR